MTRSAAASLMNYNSIKIKDLILGVLTTTKTYYLILRVTLTVDGRAHEILEGKCSWVFHEFSYFGTEICKSFQVNNQSAGSSLDRKSLPCLLLLLASTA